MSYKTTRNSTAVRESLLDVFTQLGGLKENSLLNQWMFETGEGASLPEPARDERGTKGLGQVNHGRNRTSPVEERMFYDGREEENVAPVPRGRLQNAKAKVSAKLLGLRSRSKSKSRKQGTPDAEENTSVDSKPTTKSAHWASFFDRGRSHSRSEPTEPVPPSERPATPKNLPKDQPGTLAAKSTRLVANPSASHSLFSHQHIEQTILLPIHAERSSPLVGDVHTTLLQAIEQERVENKNAEDIIAQGKNSKRKTSVLPHFPLQSIQFPVKATRRKNRHPPDLVPIVVKPSMDRDGHLAVSRSLPPSPFILVSPLPLGYEDGVEVTTPFIFSPVSVLPPQNNEAEVSSPMYPVSISKTLRKSFLDDELQPAPIVADTEPVINSNGMRMRRVSLPASHQAIEDTSFSSRPSRPGPLRRSSSVRARESPFPTRPIRPLPVSLTMQGVNAGAVRLSLDARASVLRQRYQGAYERQSLTSQL
uniref:Uncharacterized protein n=1 Tax=Moniliophthora roreri TaxID=221103 RepID=A0A0W0GD75_MONRR